MFRLGNIEDKNVKETYKDCAVPSVKEKYGVHAANGTYREHMVAAGKETNLDQTNEDSMVPTFKENNCTEKLKHKVNHY